MFPSSFIQELKDKNDIVDVISAYVDLKNKGGKFWACCPFHQEKSASFSVDANKQFFYCFGCHAGGDVITFISMQEHLTKFEAIEYLANKANIPMPSKVDSDAEAKKQQARKVHFDMHKIAARFYLENLMRNDLAKQYIGKRGIKVDFIKKFGIGYAPDAKDQLFRLLSSKGYNEKQMLDSGLIKRGQYGIMDAFRKRVMFPIIDIYGNVIAFGGRVLDDSLPKYLNSAESVFYNKRRHLFGLNIVKNQKPITHIVLVEGYMDVVMLTNFGINGAVASLGTAFTEQQANLIKRFAKDVFLCYDADSAGQKAAMRAAGIMQAAGLNVRIIDLPKGLDPDDFVKSKGSDGFDLLLEKALLPHQFEVERLSEQYQLSEENQRRDFAIAALRIVAKLTNNLDIEDMIKYLQVKTGYSADALNIEQLSLSQDQKKVEEKKIQRPVTVKKDTVRDKAERMILKLALNGMRQQLLERMQQVDFDGEFNAKVFDFIKEQQMDESLLLNRCETHEDSAKAVEIIKTEIGKDYEKIFEDCYKIIIEDKLIKERDLLLKQLEEQSAAKLDTAQLLEKINEIQIKIQEI